MNSADLHLYKAMVPAQCRYTPGFCESALYERKFQRQRATNATMPYSGNGGRRRQTLDAYFNNMTKRQEQLWGIFEGEPFHKHADFWDFYEENPTLFDVEVSWRRSAHVPAMYCKWRQDAQDMRRGGVGGAEPHYGDLYKPAPKVFESSTLVSAFVSNPGGTWDRKGLPD